MRKSALVLSIFSVHCLLHPAPANAQLDPFQSQVIAKIATNKLKSRHSVLSQRFFHLVAKQPSKDLIQSYQNTNLGFQTYLDSFSNLPTWSNYILAKESLSKLSSLQLSMAKYLLIQKPQDTFQNLKQ